MRELIWFVWLVLFPPALALIVTIGSAGFYRAFAFSCVIFFFTLVCYLIPVESKIIEYIKRKYSKIMLLRFTLLVLIPPATIFVAMIGHIGFYRAFAYSWFILLILFACYVIKNESELIDRMKKTFNNRN